MREREKSLWVSESAAFLFEKGWFGGVELREWYRSERHGGFCVVLGFGRHCSLFFVWMHSIYVLWLSSLSHSVYFLLFCYLGNVIPHRQSYAYICIHSFTFPANSSHTHIILLLCLCVFVVTNYWGLALKAHEFHRTWIGFHLFMKNL